MQLVIELHIFSRQAEGVFGRDQRERIATFIAEDPEGSPVEPGTGGIRKRRFGAGGKGTRGGARVLYLHFDRGAPIYLLLAYPKGKQEKMTPDERKLVKRMVETLKSEWKARNR